MKFGQNLPGQDNDHEYQEEITQNGSHWTLIHEVPVNFDFTGNNTGFDVKSSVPAPPAHDNKGAEDEHLCLGTLLTNVPAEVTTSSEIPNEYSHLLEESLPPHYGEDLPGRKPEDVTQTQTISYQDAIERQERIIDAIWPSISHEARKEFPEFAKTFDAIKKTKVPNYLGAEIPVKSDLTLHEWERRLEGYHDQLLPMFLKYGWPLGYHRNHRPVSSFRV